MVFLWEYVIIIEMELRDYIIDVIDYLLQYGEEDSYIYFCSDNKMHEESLLHLFRPNIPNNNGLLDTVLNKLQKKYECIDFWSKQTYTNLKQLSSSHQIAEEISILADENPRRNFDDIVSETLAKYKEYKIKILDRKKLESLRVELAGKTKGDEVAFRLITHLNDGSIFIEVTKTNKKYELEKEIKSDIFLSFLDYADKHQKKPFSLSDVCKTSYDIYDFLGNRFFKNKNFSKPFFEVLDGKKKIVIANFSPTYDDLKKRNIDYASIANEVSQINNNLPF